jgi:hypothetical protein
MAFISRVPIFIWALAEGVNAKAAVARTAAVRRDLSI